MTRSPRPVVSLVVLTVLLIGGVPSVAQQPGTTELVSLTEEVAKLNANLGAIARSLRTMVYDQKVQVLIRRIELEERRQAPLNDELRTARASVRAQKEELARMEGVLENIRNQIDEAIRQGADPQSVPERGELEQFEAMVGLEREHLADEEARAIDLENDVARARDRVIILDEKLQELLDASE